MERHHKTKLMAQGFELVDSLSGQLVEHKLK